LSTSSSSHDENSENQIFFIAPKGAYDPQTFNLVQVNYHMMNALVKSQSKVYLEPASLQAELLSLYSNYFSQKAIAASNVDTAFHALKGLKFLNS